MTAKRLFVDKDQNIIDDYLACNLTVDRILEKHRISRPTLYNFLRETGTPFRGNVIKEKQYNEKEIVEKFLSGINKTEIVDAYNINRGHFSYIIRKHGHQVGPHLSLCNHKAFSNINYCESLLPERNYWVGFLIADGCISVRKGSKTIDLLLATVDKDHLVKFKEFLGSLLPIKTIVRNSGYKIGSSISRLRISSNE